MPYLQELDYTRLISIQNLDEILSQAASGTFTNDTVRTNAENIAIAEVKSYLNVRYDVVTEYGKQYTDATRNENIIRCTLVIAIYNLHFTINPRDIPEIREKSYKMVREDLKAVRDGVLDFGLTKNPDTATVGMKRTEIYSARKFVSKPYEDAIFLNPETPVDPTITSLPLP